MGLRTNLILIGCDIVCASPSLRSAIRSGCGRTLRAMLTRPADLFGATQLGERLQCGFYQIVRVGRTQALGEDIANTCQLDHGAYAARRDNAGAFGGRL